MVVLFGSYAKGNAHKDSDIDIAIVVDNLNDDFLEKYNQLFKLRRGIDSRIEPVLIDADDDQSGFYEEVINSGRVIYES
jgi:predicted nucleotidyltransferase